MTESAFRAACPRVALERKGTAAAGSLTMRERLMWGAVGAAVGWEIRARIAR